MAAGEASAARPERRLPCIAAIGPLVSSIPTTMLRALVVWDSTGDQNIVCASGGAAKKPSYRAPR